MIILKVGFIQWKIWVSIFIIIPYIGFTEMIIILPRSNKYSSAYDYINEEKVNFSDLI